MKAIQYVMSKAWYIPIYYYDTDVQKNNGQNLHFSI
jgi:hypothetical protein